MSAIGILGGMGPQASARLQTLLVRDVRNFVAVTTDIDYPEIVHLSAPVPNFITNKNNFEQAKRMLIERTKLLEQANCVINGIACNTAHLLLPDLQQVTTVPFVSIPKLVAKRIEQSGFTRIGLLATPTTLASDLYDSELGDGIDLIRPDSAKQAITERLIFKQLRGELTDKDSQALHLLVDEFMNHERLDAVILGCTELPLIYGETKNEKIIDTLQILSDGLLEAYYAITRRNHED